VSAATPGADLRDAVPDVAALIRATNYELNAAADGMARGRDRRIEAKWRFSRLSPTATNIPILAVVA
jgi:hypothetical protein